MAAALRWAALFSGQGGQRTEHAQHLRASLPDDLRAAWLAALARAGVDADALDDRTLVRNRVAQPTLCAWQVGAWRTLAALPPPVLVAGYSVGELAACAAAGGYANADAIALAAARAECMDAAHDASAGLAAVVGLSEHELAPMRAAHGVAIAIRNGVRHFIVGGPEAALIPFLADATAAGAVRAQRLAVETPAHTPWLASAVPCFAAALVPVLVTPLRVPMLSGIDARSLRSAADAAAALARQLATPLDWGACMEAVAEAQPHAVLEIGPGDALARMFVEAVPDVPARALGEFREPRAAIAWLDRERRLR